MTSGPQPTGLCFCGCGQVVAPGAFFVQGHDKIAESAVIMEEYGGVVEFLDKHGYGPGAGQKNARKVFEARKSEALQRLRGSVTRYDDPFGPAVAPEEWAAQG